MRWTDNSMGSDFDWGWSDINQAFSAGQVGMFISGSDVYTNMVQSYNINPSIYGLAPIPLANNQNAGVLGGGTLPRSREGDAGPGSGSGEVDRFLLPQKYVNAMRDRFGRQRQRPSSQSAGQRSRSSTRPRRTSTTVGSIPTSTSRSTRWRLYDRHLQRAESLSQSRPRRPSTATLTRLWRLCYRAEREPVEPALCGQLRRPALESEGS